MELFYYFKDLGVVDFFHWRVHRRLHGGQKFFVHFFWSPNVFDRSKRRLGSKLL